MQKNQLHATIAVMGSALLEIIKILPKTNCGKCGEVSCLAFAMALSTGKRLPEECPYLDRAKLPTEIAPQPASELDQAYRILEEIKKKVQNVDFEKVAPGLGLSHKHGRLHLPYLDGEVELTKKNARRLDGLELDPRDQILLYNYVIFQGYKPLTGEFVGLETFPNSISKVATLRRYAEEKLARALNEDFEDLRSLIYHFRSRELSGEADLAVEILVLPRVPLRVYFWRGDPEEGLSPEAKILYDLRATEYLDLESLVFCAERLVERWLELGNKN